MKNLANNLRFKRLRQALVRACATMIPEELDNTYRACLEELKAKEKLHRSMKSSKNAPVNQQVIKALHRDARHIHASYRRMKKGLDRVIKTKNRVFNGCTPEEMEGKMQAIMNIPLTKFRHFDSLTSEAQETRLIELIEEHGKPSGNGYASNMLLIPGYNSPYLMGEEMEPDGSEKRPQFIHEMMDRVLYAALYPSRFKALFFRPTAKDDDGNRKLCKRWNDTHRQIRAEGRLGIVKVMIALFYKIDFKASLRAGYYHKKDGSYSGVPISKLMEVTGLSRSSVNTALKTLVDMNLLYGSKQPYETYKNEEGETCYKGLPVVRRFHLNLIHRLGLTKRWYRERVKAKVSPRTPELEKLVQELDDLYDIDDNSAYIRKDAFIDMKMTLLAAGA